MLNYIWFFMMAGGIVFSAFSGKIALITTSMLDSTKEAVSLCILMLGVLGMWSGIMEIAIQSGLVRQISGKLRPILSFLYPGLPKNHPAWEYIVGNMTANIMGLGMGATALGIQAMRELEKSNPEPGTATDEMCIFLIINISSLQLIPVNMIAYRQQYGSVNPTQIILPSLLATFLSTLTAVLYCAWRGRKSSK